MTFDAYQSSSAQKRLVLINQLYGDHIVYNIPHAWVIEGHLDARQLEKSLQKLSERHESLRTCFAMKEGKVLQKVFQQLDFRLNYRESSGAEIDELVRDFIRPFDLGQVPLWRTELVQLASGRQLFLFDIHHTVADGTSINVLIRDLMAFYMGNDLEPLEFQYVDYTMWQNDMLSGELIEKQERYWLEVFSGDLPVLDLPYDFPRGEGPKLSGESIDWLVDAEMAAALNRLAVHQGTTLFVVLLALYNILLYRYTGQEDIIVGSPISGRTHREFEDIIGMFVNTLALRNYPKGGETVNAFIETVSSRVFSAFNNQDYPFEMLVEKLVPQRQINRNPLMDTFFVLQNFDQDIELFDHNHNRLRVIPYPIDDGSAKFDLTMYAYERGDELLLRMEYGTALFQRQTIERMGRYFKNLLREVCENSYIQIGDLELLDKEEREWLLFGLNRTGANYPVEKTIHGLFEDAVYQRGENTALVVHEISEKGYRGAKRRVSYDELNKEAKRVADELRKRGVRQGTIVALLLQPSVEMLAAILGVLHAGGAYLPMDPEHPVERRLGILEDSAARFLLTDKKPGDEKGLRSGWDGEWIGPDELERESKPLDVLAQHDPADVAYIIYTSGSTGKPKGVMIEHGQVVRLLFNDRNLFDFTSEDSWTLFHSYCFDFSVWEMYGALLYGGKLHVFPRGLSRDSEGFLRLLVEEGVTILNQTPSAFYNLVEMEAHRRENQPDGVGLGIRYVIFGGEALNPSRLAVWQQWYPGTVLINMFGITETTVHVTFKKIGAVEIASGRSNIGRPLPTLRTYVLDGRLKPVPLGVPGELYVGGAGVGRGYLNRPELTGQRFIGDTFVRGGRLYRSGDRVRLIGQGDMEYLGRIDFQVQIKGYRIELGEIENRLSGHRGVKTAIVTTGQYQKEIEGGALFLCGYIVPETGVEEGRALVQATPADAAAGLKSYLSRFLPEYMVPTFLIMVEDIPLTPNGKVDKKALPDPLAGEVSEDFTAPRDEIEKKLAGTWSEVLQIGLERIGIDTGFFTVGGHSLNATVLLAKIHKAFDVKIPLAELFRNPTIRALGQLIKGLTKSIHRDVQPQEEKEYYPLSSGQKRLFLLAGMKENSTTYNMPSVFRVEGPLDVGKLEKAFYSLIQRHETLRTSFTWVNGEPVQWIHGAGGVEFKLEYYKLEKPGWGRENTHRVQVIMRDEFIRPFDLSGFPLMRVGWLGVKENDYLLLVDLHHMVSDGTSMGILADDFIRLYEGENLAPLVLQYRDYAVWQNGLVGEGTLRSQEQYWFSQFPDGGDIPVLELPIDFPRPGVFSFSGDYLEFRLGAEETARVRGIVAETGTTLFMTLLSALYIFLYRYTGQEDMVVGTGVMGRRHADLQEIIGMFINSLALRIQLQPAQRASKFLQVVKESTLKAFENQDIQFEELVEGLKPQRDTSRNPLFDVVLVVQNFKPGKKDMRTVSVSSYPLENKTAKFDLTFFVYEEGEELAFVLEYCTSLFTPATSQRMVNHYLAVVREMCSRLEGRIVDFEFLSVIEKEMLLERWNDTGKEFPVDIAYPELFEQQVEKTRDVIALVGRLLTGGEGYLSYGELNDEAEKVARFLGDGKQKRALEIGEPVGVMLDATVERVVALVGVMKAGGAFVPLDPDLPGERLGVMVRDGALGFIVSSEMYLRVLNNLQKECPKLYTCFLLEERGEGMRIGGEAGEGKKGRPVRSGNEPAYIIYTSGTTGIPKGVMVEHRSLNNLCGWHNDYYQITSRDRATQYAGMGFDAAVWEIFPYLVKGAAVYMVERGIRLDVEKLRDYIKIHNITVAFLPTQMCEQFMAFDQTGAGLRCLLTGGDKLHRKPKYSQTFAEGHYVLYNNYGPTENTVVTTVFGVEEKREGDVPIGKPIANTRVYILNKETLKLQPQGVAGELCIGGIGLARGYLNRPELTQEKFINAADIKDLQEQVGSKKWLGAKSLYRTGDLARWLGDGNIEFMGRIDQQVKIRGFRIELEEIENHLLGHGQVKEAVAIVVTGKDGSKYICAYVVGEGTGKGNETDEVFESVLKDYLAQRLPGYMIPARIVGLEVFPLTRSGKVDRKALVSMGQLTGGKGLVLPRTEIEKKLAVLWSELLHVPIESIGIDDDFFQLGGHSLRANQLVLGIHQRLEVKVPLLTIFRQATIRGLVQYISQEKRAQHEEIKAVEQREYYALSPAQKRLYVVYHLEPGSTGYNIPLPVILEGEVERGRMEKIFQELIRRHESLRTSLITIGSQPFQRVHEAEITASAFSVNEFHIAEREEAKSLVNRLIRPFELEQVPLFRVSLIRLMNERGSCILLVDIHHIIADGQSMNTICHEFMDLYRGKTLAPLKIQYRDYTSWMDSEEQKQVMLEQERFWLKELTGEIPLLALPTDYLRPAQQYFAGGSFSFAFDRVITERLKVLAQGENVTVFILLLSVYYILLSRLSGQDELVVGVPVFGRRHADLQNIVGMFINTLVLRNYPAESQKFRDFLAEVGERTLRAFDNQEYPFDRLVEILRVERHPGRNPLFDVTFQFLNLDGVEIEIPGLKLKPFPLEVETAKFDISFSGIEVEDELVFTIRYNRRLFKAETIAMAARYFQGLTLSVLREPGGEIKGLSVIQPGERDSFTVCPAESLGIMERECETVFQDILNDAFQRFHSLTAIEYAGETWTYEAVVQRSARIAEWLVNNGAGKETFVGIYTRNRLNLILSIIGVLQAGAIFVPLDPVHPVDRLQTMSETATLEWVITDEENDGEREGEVDNRGTGLAWLLAEQGVKRVDLAEIFCVVQGREEVKWPGIGHEVDDKIYVYFTSGSTGKPKAIVGRNKGLRHFIEWEMREFGFSVGARVSQLTTPGFDAFLRDVFLPLCGGGTLCIPAEASIITGPEALAQWVDECRIQYIHCVPSIFRVLKSSALTGSRFQSLRYIFLSGERIHAQELRGWYEIFGERIQLVNFYGSTETTMVKAFYRIGMKDLEQARLPVGEAIPGAQLLVLDSEMNVCAPLITGEIYIRTRYGTHGYHRDDELNGATFIQNPFSREPGDILQKTGDVGRYLSDGLLDLVGRKDRQVKIRGIRVEPGEIEAVLQNYPGVSRAVVIKRDLPAGNEMLCAYVTVRESGIDQSEQTGNIGDSIRDNLRNFARKRMPGYMVPSFIKVLERIPLLANGKVDWRALPDPREDDSNLGINRVAPRDKMEEMVLKTWSEVLGINPGSVSIDSDFFHIGGHSLNATLVLNKIHGETDVRIPLPVFFTGPTVRLLAEYIETAQKDEFIPLEPLEEREEYPLSSAQKRLYLLDRFESVGIGYNMPAIYEVEGRLDDSRLERAFKMLIGRHESLRTSFHMRETEPVQRVHGVESIQFNLEYFDWPSYCLDVNRINVLQVKGDEYGVGFFQEQEAVGELVRRRFIRPFELFLPPLLRVGVVRQSENRSLLLFDLHHIVGDGASMSILAEDFVRLYEGEGLPGLNIQYKEYAVWQNRMMDSGAVKKQETYWLALFHDAAELPVLDLLTDYPRPAVFTFIGDIYDFFLGAEDRVALERLGRRSGVTLFMTVMAALDILFYKYTGQHDIVVGAGIMGRRHQDVEKVPGMFVNTLAMRNQPRSYLAGGEFLEQVKQHTLGAYENQDVQFEVLVERLNLRRDSSRNPLFDTALVVQNFAAPRQEKWSIKIGPYPLKRRTAKLDFNFFVFEEGDGLRFQVEFCTSLYRVETIQRMSYHLTRVLDELAENIDLTIDEMDIMSPQEREEVLYGFNDTDIDMPMGKPQHWLFEDQVEKRPDAVAVVGQGVDTRGTITVTYRELNNLAEMIANRLLDREEKKPLSLGEPVGVLLNASVERIAAILGVMKAGGAFVPMEPSIPSGRLLLITRDAALGFMVSQTAYLQVLNNIQKECRGLYTIICLDDVDNHVRIVSRKEKNTKVKEKREEKKEWKRPNLFEVGSPAYIIYTSGSTGIPKGVIIEHDSLNNSCGWQSDYYGINELDHITQYAGIGFDAAILEIFPALGKGASLYIVDADTRLDEEKLREYYVIHSITIGFLPTQMCEQFIGYSPGGLSLRCLWTGGDKLNRFHQVPYELYNNYGPTENTVVTTACRVEERYGMDIPIGKPVANTRVYILHKETLRLQPVGVVGELCIAGIGLARGYLNRPGLTHEKFVVSQRLWFRAGTDEIERRGDEQGTGSRFYRTGDLARWRNDGNIQFIGRMDQQVKIRGFRIELGEIENRLLKHEIVKEAVVTAVAGDGENKFPCAYLVLAESEAVKGVTARVEKILRPFLAEFIPEYMIPTYFMVLERLPLTPSGKVDRKALPAPGITGNSDLYIAPRNGLEHRLAVLWSEILQVLAEAIGIDDDFFRLGGHSLRAAVLVGKIHKALGVKIPLAVLFQSPTIRGLHDYILRTGKDEYNKYTGIEPVEKREYYGLSSVQGRMYFLAQLGNTGTAYNIPHVMTLEGAVDFRRFEKVFIDLIDCHEILRTSFVTGGIDNLPVQHVHDHVEFSIQYEELVEKKSVGEMERLVQAFIRPFDLARAPLLRVALYRLIGENEKEYHMMMIDLHHIIADGMSVGILIREFMELYRGIALPVPRLQYRDYAMWENSGERQLVLQEQETYWLKRMSGEIPVLILPYDYPRSQSLGMPGGRVRFELEEMVVRELKQYCHGEDVTLFMLLLAVMQVLLWKISGQEDIIIGTPVAARRHEELQSMIGMFVNTIALRHEPSGKKLFTNFLQEVKEKTLRDFENQEYSLAQIVEKVGIVRDTSRNPLFDVMLTLQNMELEEMKIPGLILKPYDFEKQVARFDLDLAAVEWEERVFFSFEYHAGLFKEGTIRRMKGYFQEIIRQVVVQPAILLHRFDILGEAEKQQILEMGMGEIVRYDGEQTVHDWCEEQVGRTPDHLAVVKNNEGLTFRELNVKASGWERWLRQNGIGRGSIVGFMAERSIEGIAGLLGILKAGAAYLPIASDCPHERVKYMLADSQASILLAGGGDARGLEMYFEEFCTLDVIFLGEKESTLNQTRATAVSSDPVYIIYTSGTTGKPKGVIVEHKNVVNMLTWFGKRYGIGEGVISLQMSDITFDPSVEQIFVPLTHGGVLCLVGKEIMLDLDALRQYIDRNQVDSLGFVPSLLDDLLGHGPELKSIRYVLSGGERLADVVKDNILKRGYALYNHYGPTETTIDALIEKCTGASVTLGYPVPNSYCFILDAYFESVPLGVAGELFIGGEGVTRGYLNQPELTAERFAFFSGARMKRGKCEYRTGDLVRWLDDGRMEFLGRLDHQVKIRGFRVELGEIESRLLEIQGVKAAVVVARSAATDGRPVGGVEDKYLCAYIVREKGLDGGVQIDGEGLKERLLVSLPRYMVPSYYIFLEEMPLNLNKKVDRRALPVPDLTVVSGTMPRNGLERTLSAIWSEILNIPAVDPGLAVDIDSHFFDLGGHSLKITQLVAAMQRRLGVNVPPGEIFTRPTIRSLAEYIQATGPGIFKAVEPVEQREYYPMSSAQERLYVVWQLNPGTIAYHMPSVVRLEGLLEQERLEQVFKRLVERHESFRTSFINVSEEPVQRVHEWVDFGIEYQKRDEREEVERQVERFIRPFDLSCAPLLRVGVIEASVEQHILIVDVHHIIGDGLSTDILMREFTRLYNGEELAPLVVQYRDFSVWQKQEMRSGVLKRQEQYWLERFQGEIPRLQLPTDYPRTSTTGLQVDGARCRFETGQSLASGIKRLVAETRVTMFQFLLAVYTILLSQHSREMDIVIGCPSGGRTHADLEAVVGMFVNMLPIRNRVEAMQTFREFLGEVREHAFAAFENQEYAFDDLVAALGLQGETGHNPLFDAAFSFDVVTEGDSGSYSPQTLKVSAVGFESSKSIYELILRVLETPDNIYMVYEYKTALFSESTIEKYSRRTIEILEQVVKDGDIYLKDIEFSSELIAVQPVELEADDGDFRF